MEQSVKRPWISGLALFASLHLLLFYGLPGGILFVILILLGVLYFRAGALAAVTTTLALGLATLFCAVAIHLLGLDKAMYYRPHEQLVVQDYDQGHRAYRKNARVEMDMPHGDLKALTAAPLAQPRRVLFRTDGAGFRNEREYATGQVVLVGDSFVVGMGDSQPDILSVQLERDWRIPAYNLGHPGDISDYLATWRAFRARHPGPLRGALFLFEGNDFETGYEPAKSPGWNSRWLGAYYGLFTGTDLYRVTKSLYVRATKARAIARSGNVRMETLAGQRMGFYAPYIGVSQRADYAMPAGMAKDLEELAGQMEQVFFIPTKYRIYAPLLGENAPPHAQWRALERICAQRGWRCADLTPALAAASAELFKRGEFTWWLDDTHWNRQGMAVAARAVAASMGAGPLPAKVTP